MGPRFRLFLWRWQMRLARLWAAVPWPSSPGRLMLLALGLVAIAWLMRGFRFFIWQPVGVVALALFTLALVTYFGRPTTQRDVRWRGRVVGERRLSWWERFYRWLYRQ